MNGEPLRLVTIGTGTCVPSLRRKGPCTLLVADGWRCVIDLGLGAMHGLLAAGVPHAEIDILIFTHKHPDHVSEWVPFLFAANYDEIPRTKPLHVVAHPDTLDTLRGVANPFGDWLRAKNYVCTESAIRHGEALRLGPYSLEALATVHHPSSLAYRVEVGKRVVVVSGDTGPTDELSRFAAGADVLLVEASLPTQDLSCTTHLSVAQACEVGLRAGAGHTLLYHLYPASEAAAAEVRRVHECSHRVEVARDGMELHLA